MCRDLLRYEQFGSTLNQSFNLWCELQFGYEAFREVIGKIKLFTGIKKRLRGGGIWQKQYQKREHKGTDKGRFQIVILEY